MFLNRAIVALCISVILIPSGVTTTNAAFLTSGVTQKQANFDRIAINGIKFGMPASSVLRKLGKPQKISEVKLCYGKVERLSYAGMTVDISGEHVSAIEVTQKNLGIDQVVKIGDNVSKVKQSYGTEFVPSQQEPNLWIVQPKVSQFTMSFTTNKSLKITKIAIFTDCCFI